MNFARLSKHTLLLICCLLLALPVAAQDSAIELEAYTSEDFGISGLTPVGWTVAGPGVYARGANPADFTLLIQQAAPGVDAATLTQGLLPSLGLDALPDAADTIETAALSWQFYEIEVEASGLTILVDLALAEADGTTYLILMQTSPEDYDSLHTQVFEPVLNAFAPLAAADAGEADAGPAEYADPEGLYSIPIPTNWTATQEDGYGLLSSPNDEVIVFALIKAGDDLEVLLNEAMAERLPDVALEYDEDAVQNFDDAAIIGPDLERVMLITYLDGTGDDGAIVQALGQVYDGLTYILLFDTTLEAAQRRGAQINIINTGFEISSLEQDDLSEATPLPVDDAIIAELEAFIDEWMVKLEVPGAAVAIVQDGAIVYEAGFGVRELGTDAPVTPDTLMMIGSTTKPMTTTVMAMLVDEGLMEWETPVVDILPEFSVQDPELTDLFQVQNLVCACTGVPRRDFELIFNALDLDAEEIVNSLSDYEVFTDFGEAFQYSNQLVATAGYVAAAAAGSEYGALYDGYDAMMQARLLDPLGMSRTTLSLDEAVADTNVAMPHSLNADASYSVTPLIAERFATPVAPAGAIWSSVHEMSEYILLQLNQGIGPDGTRLVSEENLNRTRQSQVAVSATMDYGLGWFVNSYKQRTYIEHGGNTIGFTSDLAFIPDAGLGIIVLSNQQASSFNSAVRGRLLELIFDQEPELEGALNFTLAQAEEQITELRESLQETPDAETLSVLVGRYSNDALGIVDISVDEEGRLMLDAGDFQTELRLFVTSEGEDQYRTFNAPIAGIPLDFTDGATAFTIGSGVVEYRFDKES